jgi:hypothetical protein
MRPPLLLSLLLLAGCANMADDTSGGATALAAPPAGSASLDITVSCLLEADMVTWAKLRLSPVQIKQVDALRTQLRTSDPGLAPVTADSAATASTVHNTMPPQQFTERLQEVAQVLTPAQARKWEDLCPPPVVPR